MRSLKTDVLRQLDAISHMTYKAESLYSLLYGKDRALEKYLYSIVDGDLIRESRDSLKRRRNKYSFALAHIVQSNAPEPESCSKLFEAVKDKIEAILNEEYSEDDEQNAVYLLRLLKINGLKAALQTKNPYERTIRAVEEFLDDEEEDNED